MSYISLVPFHSILASLFLPVVPTPLSCSYFHCFLWSLPPSLVTECDSKRVDSQPEGRACRFRPWGINHRSQDQYQRTVSWVGYRPGWQRLTDERAHCYTGQKQYSSQCTHLLGMHWCTDTKMHKYTHTHIQHHQSLWNRYIWMCLQVVCGYEFMHTWSNTNDVDCNSTAESSQSRWERFLSQTKSGPPQSLTVCFKFLSLHCTHPFMGPPHWVYIIQQHNISPVYPSLCNPLQGETTTYQPAASKLDRCNRSEQW